MKKIEDMTNEELQELLVFNTQAGPMYYSRIGTVNPTTHILIYDEKPYKLSQTTADRLTAGKLRYEAYALSMTKSDAEQLLKTKAQDVLQAHFDAQIKNTVDKFSVAFDTLHETFHSAAATLVDTQQVADDIVLLKDKVNKTLNNFDAKTLQARLEAKLVELKPVAKEFENLTKSLKTLFKD